jgi:hypothetical protein
MSGLTTPAETGLGFAPPTVTQFSVFLDNRVGKLHAASHLVAISVHDASDHAVVRLITTNAEETRKLLQRQSIAFSEVSLLVVELCKGHTLERMCLYLLSAELNIRFAYPIMCSGTSGPMIALAVDDVTLAGQILRRKEFRLLAEADLARQSG